MSMYVRTAAKQSVLRKLRKPQGEGKEYPGRRFFALSIDRSDKLELPAGSKDCSRGKDTIAIVGRVRLG